MPTSDNEESVIYIRDTLKGTHGLTQEEIITAVSAWIGDDNIRAGFDYAVKNKIIIPLKKNFFGKTVWVVNKDRQIKKE